MGGEGVATCVSVPDVTGGEDGHTLRLGRPNPQTSPSVNKEEERTRSRLGFTTSLVLPYPDPREHLTTATGPLSIRRR